ncbi:MAG TPA: pilus assembly protein TadG-related protein, partial [Devosia sp.]|nr:pilus assembly protein TadG-related protein [Devosia sp.]
MRRWAELITRFGRDESGVFAVVFGVMAIVLIAFGGAAVDYVSMEQVRNRSQIALDAAALALQPDIFDSNISEESIRKRAEDLMIERIGDDRVTATLDPVRIDRAGGSLQLSARIVTPTLFVSLVGVNS